MPGPAPISAASAGSRRVGGDDGRDDVPLDRADGGRVRGRGAVEAGAGSPRPRDALFVAGYLAAWAGIGLAGYTLIEAVRSLDIGFLAWDEAGRYVAGGVILGAAAYQLTPLKDTCLRQCRRPEAFVHEHWRPGALGALRMGAEHGAFASGAAGR